MPINISSIFDGTLPHSSKSHKALAEYIRANSDKATLMTASKLGAAVGVSESTVVRFAMFLGYQGYPEFQEDLRKYMRAKLTSVQRIAISSSLMNTQNMLDEVFERDIANIKATSNEISREEFEEAADTIVNAKRIYIVGLRSSRALAEFMGFYFNLMLPGVSVIKNSGESDIYDNLFKVTADDAVILISFPRYSAGITEAARFARERGANTIVITDSSLSPLLKYADTSLFAKSEIVSFADSLVAPMSLINALIAAVSMKKKADLEKSLSELERVWSQYDVYEKTDGKNG